MLPYISLETAKGWRVSPVVCGLVAALAILTPGDIACADDTSARGVVKTVNQTEFSTDVPMRARRVPFREGQRFNAGDILVEFDCRRQFAERDVAQAAVDEASLTLSSNVSLNKHKAIGKYDVEIARARLARARGELRSLQARSDDCTVRAPYAGRISELRLRALEFAPAQRPYLSIIEDRNFEIELIVSSAAMVRLKPGQAITFQLDELPDQPIAAEIALVGAVVDPVSKTGKVVARVRSGPTELAAGMSGTAHFGARSN